MAKKFYITTAIDYANGQPHLGHAYEKILADVIARYRRIKGEDVHFLTGLDEHGQKVQQSAQKQGIQPQELCDKMAQKFQELCGLVEISHDDYIRTTEKRHKDVVNQILVDLLEKGDIYKAEYTGFYSIKEEQFLQEKDRVDGEWPEHFGEVIEISESNYFFKLSRHQEWLVNHINNNPDFIFPSYRAKQVLEFLKEPINDLCISRPKERLAWGIPLPFDENFVSYVWFDALLNYVSAVGYGTDDFENYWPCDLHVIGKDILVPPHAVYWPIMLHAIGIELPKTFLVHGWWMSSGTKMSKSKGNVVDPLSLIQEFGADPFRYFLIREMCVGKDSDFTLELFQSRYNSELANDLGNLLSRLLNMTERYCDNKVPAMTVSEDPEQELHRLADELKVEIPALFEGYQFHTALEKLSRFVTAINRYAETRAPWKLAKSEAAEDRAKLETSLATMAEGLRIATVYLAPVMPSISERIQGLLGEPAVTSWGERTHWGKSLEGNVLGEKCILFPKKELATEPVN